MKTFYFTFGQKYRHEKHPHGGHPDGWFEVTVPNGAYAEELAHAAMFTVCADLWSMCYDSPPDITQFHRGCLCSIVVKLTVTRP